MSALQKIFFCLYALGTPRRAYPTRSGAIPPLPLVLRDDTRVVTYAFRGGTPLRLLCYGTTHGSSPTRSGAAKEVGLLRRHYKEKLK